MTPWGWVFIGFVVVLVIGVIPIAYASWLIEMSRRDNE